MVEWRPVVGYEGLYEVSDAGDVRSLSRAVPNRYGTRRVQGRVLTASVGQRGRLSVNLSDGRAEMRLVHHLVLEAFVGPRPEGMECCHGDGNPGNNRLENLRWDTHTSNMLDMKAHGTNQNVRKTHCTVGHPLEAPNLKPAQAAKGGRSCLSCAREYALARVQGRPFDPAKASERYRHLVTMSA